jgi:hypothetical protein
VLGHRFSGLVAIQPGHALVTSGIYGVIRHPSYLGLLVSSLGWARMARSFYAADELRYMTGARYPALFQPSRAVSRLLASVDPDIVASCRALHRNRFRDSRTPPFVAQ